jgi:hypothetical protein
VLDVKHVTATATTRQSPPQTKIRYATYACPAGFKHGELLVDFADGAAYQGEWSCDKRYLLEFFVCAESSIANFSYGCRHGHGKMTYPDGSSYVRCERARSLAWHMCSTLRATGGGMARQQEARLWRSYER